MTKQNIINQQNFPHTHKLKVWLLLTPAFFLSFSLFLFYFKRNASMLT